MKYDSTRGAAAPVFLSEAILRGAAPDGGLYVPERLAGPGSDDQRELAALAERDELAALPGIAALVLAPYFEGDGLASELPEICSEAFDFPVRMRPLAGEASTVEVLELFHGPTGAFKDLGARFLAACMRRLARDADRRLTVLVATSGDTGGAVAAAFAEDHGGAGAAEVVILYPHGRVSPLQERQLTDWPEHVRSFAVHGTFDDCQRLVRAALDDRELARGRQLVSANSINIGRLLPQLAYHAAAALVYRKRHGRAASFAVPTGNAGNATACAWARQAGMPIGNILLATNANRALVSYLEGEGWQPGEARATLASAMDVGDPSNFERLRHLFPELARMQRELRACSASDEELRAAIRSTAAGGTILCPHTAAALHGLRRSPEPEAHWVLVATAHPAKFADALRPIIGEIELPQALRRYGDQPLRRSELDPELADLRVALA